MTTAATRRAITIDHVVIASNQPYEKVLEGLQSQMGSEEGWRQTEQRIQDLVAAQASLEQVEETIERQLGTAILRSSRQPSIPLCISWQVKPVEPSSTWPAILCLPIR